MYSEITNVHITPQQTAFAKCIMTYILITWVDKEQIMFISLHKQEHTSCYIKLHLLCTNVNSTRIAKAFKSIRLFSKE